MIEKLAALIQNAADPERFLRIDGEKLNEDLSVKGGRVIVKGYGFPSSLSGKADFLTEGSISTASAPDASANLEVALLGAGDASGQSSDFKGVVDASFDKGSIRYANLLQSGASVGDMTLLLGRKAGEREKFRLQLFAGSGQSLRRLTDIAGDPHQTISLYRHIVEEMKPVKAESSLAWPLGIKVAAWLGALYVVLNLLGGVFHAAQTSGFGGGEQLARQEMASSYAQAPDQARAPAAPSAQPRDQVQAQAQAQEQARRMVAQQREIMDPEGMQLEKGVRVLSKSQRAVLEGLPKNAVIELGKADGPALVVFSDPLCPFCQAQEPVLERLAGTHRITIVPVSYKEGARELVSRVLCSAEKDRPRAWKAAMTTGPQNIKAQSCDKGFARADENNKVFEALGFNATPTLVNPHGISVASALDVQEVEQLIKASLPQ